MESPGSHGTAGSSPFDAFIAGHPWIASPRFWLALMAAAALALGIGFGVEAILVEPIRLGFGISSIAFLVAAAGCGAAAVRPPRED